jgi:DegV family protein with EDD domain
MLKIDLRSINMAVKFIIDSASDVLPEEAKALGVIHMPLLVRFGEQEYRDGIDLAHTEFFERLIESDVLPTTSQVPPITFENIYKELVASGDTVVVITISSKLSGTYQSAIIAAEDYEGSVFVVDSENVTIGERILLLRGLELCKQGLSASEIKDRLDIEKKNIRLLALLDTLEYLKKGGRISAATAIAGGLLSIKPVIKVEDGLVAMAGKARGSKQGNNLLRQMTAEHGIDFSKPYALAYSGLSDILLRKYINDSADLWEGKSDNLPVHTVGCVIGTHVGPGAIAVAFFSE